MLLVAEPHMLYVASSHAGRCRCENAILVIRLQILRTHFISGCKMYCVTWNMVLAFTSLAQMHYWAYTGPRKSLHVVLVCGRVICGSPTAAMELFSSRRVINFLTGRLLHPHKMLIFSVVLKGTPLRLSTVALSFRISLLARLCALSPFVNCTLFVHHLNGQSPSLTPERLVVLQCSFTFILWWGLPSCTDWK